VAAPRGKRRRGSGNSVWKHFRENRTRSGNNNTGEQEDSRGPGTSDSESHNNPSRKMSDDKAFGIKRFDGKNFHVWKFALTTMIKMKGLMGILEGVN
jgi:hypothetical protein